MEVCERDGSGGVCERDGVMECVRGMDVVEVCERDGVVEV